MASSTPRTTDTTSRARRGRYSVARIPSAVSAATWASVSTMVSGGRGASAHPPSGTAVSVKGSAGDVDDLAGDEAGLLATRKRGVRGDVLGLADPGTGICLAPRAR